MRIAPVLTLIIACCGVTACDVIGLKEDPDFKGEFSGTMAYSVTNTPGVTCSSTAQISGRVEIEEFAQTGANVAGEGTIFVAEVGGPASPSGCGSGPNRGWDGSGSLEGTASSFSFAHAYTATGVMTILTNSKFVGTIQGDVITGTVTISHQGQGVIGNSKVVEGGSGTYNVTLRKP